VDKLQNNQLYLLKNLFESYKNNRSVIFSIFEGQFNACAYVDNIAEIHWAVLQTPFLQHFIAGEPTRGCEDVLDNILFNIILSEKDKKEVVVFSDSDKWNNILDNIYRKHNGVSDGRKFYEFSKENYNKINRVHIPFNITPSIDKCKTLPLSQKDTLSVKLISKNQIASYCNAIMVGDNKAEIDIFTDEKFRGKGLATISAILLIDKLLDEGLTPTWSTWPFRVESQHIAQKLGFVMQPDAKAWIWQEGM
jgi:hypothetical protein